MLLFKGAPTTQQESYMRGTIVSDAAKNALAETNVRKARGLEQGCFLATWFPKTAKINAFQREVAELKYTEQALMKVIENKGTVINQQEIIISNLSISAALKDAEMESMETRTELAHEEMRKLREELHSSDLEKKEMAKMLEQKDAENSRLKMEIKNAGRLLDSLLQVSDALEERLKEEMETGQWKCSILGFELSLEHQERMDDANRAKEDRQFALAIQADRHEYVMKQELERVLMEQAEGYNTEINGLFCVIRVITAGWNAAHRLAHDIDVDLGSLGLDYNTLIALVRRLNDELLALQKDYNRLWKVGREMNDVLSYAWQKYCTLSAKVDYLSREAASLRERVEMLDEALVALRVDPEVPSCPQKGMDFLRLNSKPYDWRRDYKPVRIPGTRLPSNIRFLTSNVDSSLYAVKKIPLVDVDGVNNSGNIAECVWIHQALGRHDNILPLVDVYLFGTDFVSLVMPKLKETLQGLRQRRGIFKESVALYTIRQVLTGLKALHDLGVLHRDIKLDNIGVCPRGNIKIFDFDFSRRDVVGANCTKQCGTPGYMPFEILHRHKYGFPVDVFSAGIAFHQLISPPLDYEIVTARMILSSGEFLDFEEGLSVDVQRTIETMVAEDPKERPTPTQLLAVSQTLNFRSMAYLLCCYQS